MGYDSGTYDDTAASYDTASPGPAPGAGGGDSYADGSGAGGGDGGQPQGAGTVTATFTYGGSNNGQLQISDANTGQLLFNGSVTFGQKIGPLTFVANLYFGKASVVLPGGLTKQLDVGGDMYID